LKGKNDVAVKVTVLREKENINVSGLDFSPDGKHLAVVSIYETINIWDWKNNRIVRTVEKPQGANDGLVTEPIRYSPDGRLFAACHSRATNHIVARIWDTNTWEIVHDITDPVGGGDCNAIGFTPDGESLIRVLTRINQPGDNLIIYNTHTWESIWGLRTIPFQPKALAISPDGKFIALGGAVHDSGPIRNQIAVVDMERRAIVRIIPNTLSFSFGRLAWSPDGTQLTAIGRRAWDGTANHGKGAYTGGPDTVMVFDARSGKQLSGEQWGPVGHLSLRYTPDGKYLIEGDVNGKGTGLGVRIWDGQHRTLLQEIPGDVGSLAVSRDGHYFAMGVDKKNHHLATEISSLSKPP